MSLYCLLDMGPICLIIEIDFECKALKRSPIALETGAFKSKLIARKFSPFGLLFVLSCNIHDKDECSARDRKDMKYDLFCLAWLENRIFFLLYGDVSLELRLTSTEICSNLLCRDQINEKQSKI